MTVMVDTPDVERQAEKQAGAIEPLPELETVADGTDLTLTGVIADADTLDDTLALELDMLTALVWAPPARGRAVVEALIGTRADRDAGNATYVLPLNSVLFLHRSHQIIWETVVALHDEGVPVQPRLVVARLTDQGHATRTRSAMIEIISPRHGSPVADSADLPHLAAALIDSWYRRGYTALLARMQQVTEERPTAELAGHWVALTGHQQTAETRWLAIRDALHRAV
ncbi:hypothetical protein MTX80_23415 (plasmid) [Gordonia amicalis]|nr:hypothetical protein [Gordonia amicalis]UOG23750.1 hypothetical protein MTX80_23415 [Gordonia amicalis]